MKQIEWKTLDYLPPSIEVSSDGQVRKLKSASDYKIINRATANCEVVSVSGKQYTVHRLVADAFIDRPEGCTIVRHKNDDKFDNRVENLEWISRSSLCMHSNQQGAGRSELIYCKELDQLYGSMRTASYVTQLPQDAIRYCITYHKKIGGLTFEPVNRDDAVVDSHLILYVSFEDYLVIAEAAESLDELRGAIEAWIKSQTKI